MFQQDEIIEIAKVWTPNISTIKEAFQKIGLFYLRFYYLIIETMLPM